MSDSGEVFSEEETTGDQTYIKQKNLTDDNRESSEEVDEESATEEVAPPIKALSSKTTSSKTYLTMVQESVVELTSGPGRQPGVSKNKIIENMKTKFGLTEVNNAYVIKALKAAVEKGSIEHTTGTGASGSFKVTKTYKEELKKLEKKKEKEASKKEKQKNETESTKDTGKSSKKKESSTKKQSETKSKRKVKDAPSAEEMTSPVKKKAAKKTTKQTGDIGEEKKVTKKPPIARGKENKDVKKTSTAVIKEKKVLVEKIKSLKKSNSTGSIERNVKNDDSLPGPSVDVEMPKRKGKKVGIR